MSLEKREFLIRGEDGKEYGPAGLEELREWVRENRAGLGSFVRLDESGANWEPWQHYPELVALAAEAQASRSAPGAAVLTIAPLGRRILAGVADVILSYILAVPIIVVVFIVLFLKVPSLQAQMLQFYLHPQTTVPEPLLSYLVAVYYMIFYPVLTLYMVGFHVVHGQTPAKALMHLRVVGPGGGKPPFGRLLLRGLIFSLSVYLDFFPMLYVLLNPHRRAFHDYAADTCVVEA
ncbi:MAG: RDD family protein [Methylacidiphilales bacterium]|nr:RDD family protein [Candidatus Methylacidiphilales bacterium]